MSLQSMQHSAFVLVLSLQEYNGSKPEPCRAEQAKQSHEPAIKPVRPLREALQALRMKVAHQLLEAIDAANPGSRGGSGCRPVPCRFECPLTLDLMQAPVIAEGDGLTCECFPHCLYWTNCTAKPHLHWSDKTYLARMYIDLHAIY